MNLILLCLNFFKTGLLAMGGGLATLPFITAMSEAHPDWFTKTDIANMIAVSEATPGPMGINMATYIGYKMCGVPGAILTTFSLVLPSFIVIWIVADIWKKHRNSPVIQSFFTAIRPAALGLMTAAGFSVFIIALFPDFEASKISDYLSIFNYFDWKTILLFIVFMTCTQVPKLKDIHPIAYIALGAVAGIVFSL